MKLSKWDEAQKWEHDWWGDCVNTYYEQEKQLVYASRMGLTIFATAITPYNIDLAGASVIDLGCGPTSLLLKCMNGKRRMAIDPMEYPAWVIARYEGIGIEYRRMQAENICARGFDEAWLYNVLQHVENPAIVVERARDAAKIVRVFEWLDTPGNIGHPHTLTEAGLNDWLSGHGKVEHFNQKGLWGKAYYGVFPTENYGK